MPHGLRLSQGCCQGPGSLQANVNVLPESLRLQLLDECLERELFQLDVGESGVAMPGIQGRKGAQALFLT